MTKADLVANMATTLNISKRESEVVFDALIAELQKALLEDSAHEITIRGFGHFEVVETKPRKGRNIRTGEAIAIPPKKKIRFKSYMTVA